jgi:L-lactate dehydrogenase
MAILNERKVAVVGCGFVGSASAFALMESGLFFRDGADRCE